MGHRPADANPDCLYPAGVKLTVRTAPRAHTQVQLPRRRNASLDMPRARPENHSARSIRRSVEMLRAQQEWHTLQHQAGPRRSQGWGRTTHHHQEDNAHWVRQRQQQQQQHDHLRPVEKRRSQEVRKGGNKYGCILPFMTGGLAYTLSRWALLTVYPLHDRRCQTRRSSTCSGTWGYTTC
jgi:hypothetical protein